MKHVVKEKGVVRSQLGLSNEQVMRAVVKAAGIFRDHNAKILAEGEIEVDGIPVRCKLNGYTSSRDAVLIRVYIKGIDLGVHRVLSKGEEYAFKSKVNFTYIYACELRNQ